MRLRPLRNHFLAKLGKAQEERNERTEFVGTAHDEYPVLGWVAYEREVMLTAVNEERAKLGKDPVPVTEILRVEQTAMGHVDYSSKLALYCAELVHQ